MHAQEAQRLSAAASHACEYNLYSHRIARSRHVALCDAQKGGKALPQRTVFRRP